MMRTAAILIGILTLAMFIVCSTEGVERSPNGIALPQDFASWQLVAPSYRTDNGTIRTILGNKAAQEAILSGKVNPWPDGVILAKIVWKAQVSPDWQGAIIPTDFVHVEFMVKDSKLYRETGGWDFAGWVGKDLEPYGKDRSFVEECFACHQPVKSRDYVFTKPAFLPKIETK